MVFLVTKKMEGGLRLERGREEQVPKFNTTPLPAQKPAIEACRSKVKDTRVGAQNVLLEVWGVACWG